MSRITDFTSDATAQKCRRAKYNRFEKRITQAKTREDERRIELEFLTPDALEKFPLRIDHDKDTYSVSVHFQTKEEFDLFCAAFSVSTYGGANTYRTGAITKLSRLLLRGVFKYNKFSDKLSMIVGGKRYVY